jgi:TPR repeat protein
VPKSTSAAALWLERACMPDDPVACRLLGVLRLQGAGVARDGERGRQLLVRACDAKDDEACRMLQAMESGLPVLPGEDAGVVGDGASASPADARISPGP